MSDELHQIGSYNTLHYSTLPMPYCNMSHHTVSHPSMSYHIVSMSHCISSRRITSDQKQYGMTCSHLIMTMIYSHIMSCHIGWDQTMMYAWVHISQVTPCIRAEQTWQDATREDNIGWDQVSQFRLHQNITQNKAVIGCITPYCIASHYVQVM